MTRRRAWFWSRPSKSVPPSGIHLDPHRRAALTNDRRIYLSAREFHLLEYLLCHEGSVCANRDLLDFVWGTVGSRNPAVVDAYVGRLRRKLGEKAIETIPGSGYRYTPPV